MAETITIAAKDGGAFGAYMAMPTKTPAPAVIVIQEIFGVNAVMRAKCDWLAAQGFIAVCPDLFWRIEPGIELTDRTDAEWARAFELFRTFDVDQGVEDVRAAIHTMRGHALANGKVGAMGYCLGGKLAFLTAARTSADASVGYYGVGLGALTGEAIDRPLMLHIAEKDEYVPKQEQDAIKKALAHNAKIEIHSYPGMNHAFSRPGGKHYNKEEADRADARTLEFLRAHLADGTP